MQHIKQVTLTAHNYAQVGAQLCTSDKNEKVDSSEVLEIEFIG